jgi:hypothetical protein
MFDWYRLFPTYWIQVGETSLSWDHRLNLLLDTEELKLEGPFTCSLGSQRVWIANYPYGFGSQYINCIGNTRMLPRVSTRKRLMKKLLEAQEKELEGPDV